MKSSGILVRHKHQRLQKKEVPERTLKPPCKNCRFTCINEITEEFWREIFTNFWKMSDINHQREFIARCTISINRQTITTKSNRGINLAYYFYNNGQKIRVCKHLFMSTLDINHWVISTVLKKKTPEGIIQPDLRGKHDYHKKISRDIKKYIRDHINSIPRIESHYL